MPASGLRLQSSSASKVIFSGPPHFGSKATSQDLRGSRSPRAPGNSGRSQRPRRPSVAGDAASRKTTKNDWCGSNLSGTDVRPSGDGDTGPGRGSSRRAGPRAPAARPLTRKTSVASTARRLGIGHEIDLRRAVPAMDPAQGNVRGEVGQDRHLVEHPRDDGEIAVLLGLVEGRGADVPGRAARIRSLCRNGCRRPSLGRGVRVGRAGLLPGPHPDDAAQAESVLRDLRLRRSRPRARRPAARPRRRTRDSRRGWAISAAAGR